MRSRLALLVFAGLASCTLTLSRDLAPGELRGALVLGTGPDRLPVTDARVTLAGGLAVKTDARGRFVFRRLEPGTYRLQVRWDRDGDGTIDAGLTLSRVEVTSGGGRGRDLGTVQVGAPGRIKGTIDDAGRPLTGLAVVVGGVGEFACAPDGTFDSGPMYPGTYDITVRFIDETGRASLVTPQAVVVGVGQEVVFNASLAAGSTSIVEGTGSVSGLVVSPGAASQAGAGVSLVVSNVPTTVTDDGGLFLFATVPAGVYAVQVVREGFRATSFEPVIVAGDVEVPTLALSPLDEPLPDDEVGCGEKPVLEDSDGDGIPNALEPAGCLCDPDDGDDDGLCDSVDRDRDGDGVENAIDTCPDVANAAQEDLDVDGRGDACDEDVDGDGVANASDLCPARFDLDQSASNCPSSLVMVEPFSTSFASQTSVVTFTGTCPPPPATVTLTLPADAGLLLQECRTDGTFVAKVALDPDTRSQQVRVQAGGSPAVDTTYAVSLPPAARIGATGDYATIDAAFAAPSPPQLLVLSDGDHVMSGGRTITGSFAIEAEPGTSPRILLAADLPDDTDASSAWFHVADGGSLSLRGIDVDGSGRRVRAGLLRVDAGGVAVVRDCVLRGAVAADRGTAVWNEGTARLVDSAIASVGRIGVLSSGAAASASLYRLAFEGTGAGSPRLNYFVVAEAGAQVFAREVSVTAMEGAEPGGLPSQAVVVFDANVDVVLSTFTATPTGSATVVIEDGTLASRTIRFRSNAFVTVPWPDEVYALLDRPAAGPTVVADRSWWAHPTGPAGAAFPGGRGATVDGSVDASSFTTGFRDLDPASPGWQR